MSKPVNYPTHPAALWERFYQLTQVPRPSKKEEKARAYLINIAKEKGLDYATDKADNIVIYVPATKGYEESETVIVQNHIDMVCDKTSDKEFNFETDPIDLLIEEGWITADRTTLGSDNGIGCAIALALLDEPNMSHPALELLFTMDEETGLNGALGLDGSMFKGKKLVNLDTEEWGSVYIGCAGGIDYNLHRQCEMVSTDANKVTLEVSVTNLKGGHSGVDVHLGRANAVKLLIEALFSAKRTNFEISSFSGGKAHNIIPRDAKAIVVLDKSKVEDFKSIMEKEKETFSTYMLKEDSDFELSVNETTHANKVFLKEEQEKFMNFLILFPNGHETFNWQGQEPIVNHSNNLAVVKFNEGVLFINTSLRFFDRNQVIEIEKKLIALSETFDINLIKGTEYPSWKPIFENSLVDLASDVYMEHFGDQVEVKAIHAGLECGILKDKLGEMEAISMGPNITGAHSPTESLEIDSTNKLWILFTEFLKKLQ